MDDYISIKQAGATSKWWVYCERCHETIGDAVTLDMARAKRGAHYLLRWHFDTQFPSSFAEARWEWFKHNPKGFRANYGEKVYQDYLKRFAAFHANRLRFRT